MKEFCKYYLVFTEKCWQTSLQGMSTEELGRKLLSSPVVTLYKAKTETFEGFLWKKWRASPQKKQYLSVSPL